MDFLTGMEWYPVAEMAMKILGSLVTFATVVVGLTPTKKDDAKLAELKAGFMKKGFDFLAKFSVIQKKPK